MSRVPRPPLDVPIDDLYYLAGVSPYARLALPAAPSALLIVNLGAAVCKTGWRLRTGRTRC